jgi:sugar phosphate isomerase/epimerase
MKPISLQLYSLREEAKQDHIAVLKSVAEMGYKGVEPAGLYGMEPAEFRKVVEDLGMVVSSSHGPWPTPDSLNEAVDVVSALGADIVVCGYGPDQFKDLDTVKETAAKTNEMVEGLKGTGIDLALHNHYWEFDQLGGRLIYDIFMELVPGVKCEIDTYWAANFGANDPAEQVAKYKDRSPLLHIKDGPLVKDQSHTAVGAGKIDVPAVIAAADEDVLQWVVVELDNCDTDMTQAVAESCAYLVANGLAEGNK